MQRKKPEKQNILQDCFRHSVYLCFIGMLFAEKAESTKLLQVPALLTPVILSGVL